MNKNYLMIRNARGSRNCQPGGCLLPRQHIRDPGCSLPQRRGGVQHRRGQQRGQHAALPQRQRHRVRPLHARLGGSAAAGADADAGAGDLDGGLADLAADRHLPRLAGQRHPHHHLRPHGLHHGGEGGAGQCLNNNYFHFYQINAFIKCQYSRYLIYT